MRVIVIVLMLWAGMAQAQDTLIVIRSQELPKIIASQSVGIISAEWIDTIPVWVIFMDSVRMYASYPDFDMRLKVAPGWKIDFGWKSEWVDQDGRKFNPDNVILDRPRKPRRNPFKE